MMRGTESCRFCDSSTLISIVDLGLSPLANSYVDVSDEKKASPFFPLEVKLCTKCFLAQLGEFESPEKIFSNYAYFSSFSQQWLEHCKNYVGLISAKLALNASSQVVEVASNDGYLLQYFKQKGIPVLGIEPAENVAQFAESKGIPTVCRFFGKKTALEIAKEKGKADLMVANNVLAHVPDLNDFVSGFPLLLKDTGTLTIEVPHLMKLIEKNEFDTIYHEHFSYFSLFTLEKVFEHHGLQVYDVDLLPTHGGALRIYVCHRGSKKISENILKLRKQEADFGISKTETYLSFSAAVTKVKCDLLSFLIDCKRKGKTVAGYGAPAKGNTLLNFCGVKKDLLAYTVDISPHKIGKKLPGTLIPILHPDEIKKSKPDFLLILPWNIEKEIVEQNKFMKDWGGRFVRAIPCLETFE